MPLWCVACSEVRWAAPSGCVWHWYGIGALGVGHGRRPLHMKRGSCGSSGEGGCGPFCAGRVRSDAHGGREERRLLRVLGCGASGGGGLGLGEAGTGGGVNGLGNGGGEGGGGGGAMADGRRMRRWRQGALGGFIDYIPCQRQGQIPLQIILCGLGLILEYRTPLFERIRNVNLQELPTYSRVLKAPCSSADTRRLTSPYRVSPATSRAQPAHENQRKSGSTLGRRIRGPTRSRQVPTIKARVAWSARPCRASARGGSHPTLEGGRGQGGGREGAWRR